MNKNEIAEFAINFIIDNAQPTTGPNYAVYGTLPPAMLDMIVCSTPEGHARFDAARAQRKDPRNRKR